MRKENVEGNSPPTKVRSRANKQLITLISGAIIAALLVICFLVRSRPYPKTDKGRSVRDPYGAHADRDPYAATAVYAVPSTQTSNELAIGKTRQATGEFDAHVAKQGLGTLTITDNTPYDSFVKLKVDGGRTAKRIYIRQGETFTCRNIAEGAYIILFTIGEDWDSHEKLFRQNSTYFEFGKTLFFTEHKMQDGVQYVRESITLDSVLDGNTERLSSSKSSFEQD